MWKSGFEIDFPANLHCFFISPLFNSPKQHSRCIPPGIDALNLVEGCASKRLRSAACRRQLQVSRRHRLRPATTFLFVFDFDCYQNNCHLR